MNRRKRKPAKRRAAPTSKAPEAGSSTSAHLDAADKLCDARNLLLILERAVNSPTEEEFDRYQRNGSWLVIDQIREKIDAVNDWLAKQAKSRT